MNRDLLYTFADIVDIGEASAMGLAKEVKSPSLILDGSKARKLAEELNFKFTGTIGVLILAKQYNIIPLLRPYFEKIKDTDFRISAPLLVAILNKYEK